MVSDLLVEGHGSRLSWPYLDRQLGVPPSLVGDKLTVQNFRELKKIELARPKLNYTTAPGVLILHPSTPQISPRYDQFAVCRNF